MEGGDRGVTFVRAIGPLKKRRRRRGKHGKMKEQETETPLCEISLFARNFSRVTCSEKKLLHLLFVQTRFSMYNRAFHDLQNKLNSILHLNGIG